MTTLSSPDPTALRTGLAAWFALLVTLDAAAVQWEDEPRRAIVGVTGLIQPISDTGAHMEGSTHRFNADADPGSEIERFVGGYRYLALSLKLDGYDQRLPEGVFLRMSSCSTKMAGADSSSALRAMGLGFVSAGPVLNVPRAEAGRTYPRAIVDVRFVYTRVEGVGPTTWIEKVRVISHLRDAAGVELPSPPNETVEIS